MPATFDLERALIASGKSMICGIDECARGNLAGPLFAAAVILDPDNLPTGLADSKTLTQARRDALFDAIMASALSVSIANSPPELINRINIRQATHSAMRRALAGLAMRPDHALIDGNDLPFHLICPATPVIKGDALSLSMAAASIVAKTTQIRAIALLDAQYPEYGFIRHAGYGTKEHLDALTRLGPCPAHRMSYAPVKAAAALHATKPKHQPEAA